MAQLADAEGLSCEWTWIDGETRTCVIVVNTLSGEATVINERGPTVIDQDWARLTASIRRVARGKIVSFSGSLPDGSGLELWRELLTSLRAEADSIWVDTSGEALTCAMKLGVNIKVNNAEAAEVLEYPVADPASAARAAEELRQRGASTVVLTLGKQGAVLADSAGTTHIAAPVVAAINAVGSGDSFLAGFLVALNTGHLTMEALRWAVAAGAANAACSGGAHFTYEEFRQMLLITPQS
jgi:tagatose 6-phosphate kinase